MATVANHQVIDDPTALQVRIGELIVQGRQFSAAQDANGRWTLTFGGPSWGRKRQQPEENKST